MNSSRYIHILAGALTVMAAVLLLPQDAWACPACAMREDGGIAGKLVLAAMMLLPFGLAGSVIYVLRKASSEENKNIPSGDYESAGGEQRA